MSNRPEASLSLAKLLFAGYDAGVRRRPTLRYLREYERQQWYSLRQLRDLQVRKMQALIGHAGRHVDHFAQLLSAAGLTARDFATPEDLAALPVMTKQQVRADYGSFLARQPMRGAIHKATGGSTGEPFQFQYDTDSEYHRLAVMWRGYRWGGADMGRRSAYIWSWPYAGKRGWRLAREVLYQRILGRVFFDIFSLSEQSLPPLAQRLTRLRPEIIVSYVSGAVTLAQWLIHNNVRLPAPRALITGAEPLHEPQRELLQRAFRAPVFNTYGGREFMLIASECGQHKGLHISADNLIVETVDVEGKPVTGRPGRVVITDLHNYGMPFIRYANGDVATLDPEPCSCGRGLPLLKCVEGREADVVALPDGRRLTGLYFVHLFKDFPQINQYQVIQTQPDELVVRIVPMPGHSESGPAQVLRILRDNLGPDLHVRVELVSQIALTGAGKRRVVESRIHVA